MNDLYDMMLNIKNVNKAEILEKIVKDSREYLGDEDRKCILYANYISDKLYDNSIVHRKINTTRDLSLEYLHEFIIVIENDKYYLIDPTFKQFLVDGLEKSHLVENMGINSVINFLNKGYTIIDDEGFNNYLSDVNKKYDFSKENVNFSLKDVYFDDNFTKSAK